MEEILGTRQTKGIAELNFLTNMHNKGTILKEANRLYNLPDIIAQSTSFPSWEKVDLKACVTNDKQMWITYLA